MISHLLTQDHLTKLYRLEILIEYISAKYFHKLLSINKAKKHKDIN